MMSPIDSIRSRTIRAIAAVAVATAGTFAITQSGLIAAAVAFLSVAVLAILGAWLMSEIELITGEDFSIQRREGMKFAVRSEFMADEVHELRAMSDEYGRLGQRMRRNLRIRDDESAILELIAADRDKFAILSAIGTLLANQAPACRFRFCPVELAHNEQSDRTWPVADEAEADSGWVLQAVTGGPDTEPDPDVIALGIDLARLALLKERDRMSLQHQADHDVLTGLLSRRAILAELERVLEEDQSVGLIYGDVDYFKSINDRLGHLAGDDLLTEIASRIRGKAEESKVQISSGRLGGDEYLCVLAGCSPEEVLRFVEQVGFSMNAPFQLGSITATASMSWGATHHEQGECDSSELLREADVALYQVKRQGRNSFRVFDEELREWTEEQARLEDDLARSISKRSGVHADYQPQFDKDRKIVGFEALGRWYRQGVGLVAPDDFIPLAVERGLMADFDSEMYRHVAGVLGKLRKAGQPFGNVSINVSAEWLERPDFVSDTLAALRNASVDPRTVVLEITESSLLRDLAERGQRLEELRRWGLRIAIDDFGTGYSSLSYLRSLPVDIVKLDKEFVSDVDESDQSRAIVRAILELAKALDLVVVAEGVERESQFEVLSDLGCDVFQGFLLGRPKTLEQAREIAHGAWPANPFDTAFEWEQSAPADANGTGAWVAPTPILEAAAGGFSWSAQR